MNKIGIMQGRFTEKGSFAPQVFPEKVWEKEFYECARRGFACIEWMFNFENALNNPLIIETKKVSEVINKSKVEVSGICCNYFMQSSLLNKSLLDHNINVFKSVLDAALAIGCKYIVIPLFEQSDISSANPKEIDNLIHFFSVYKSLSLQVLIESNLSADEYLTLLGNSISNVGICYDIGNSAGLGRNVENEIKELWKYIKNIHIKDKPLCGSSVMLGEGDADFGGCLKTLREYDYSGCLIMETYYNRAIEDTIKNYNYLLNVMEKV